MTWINRALIAISGGILLFVIVRFALKSWLYAGVAAVVLALILAVFLGRYPKRTGG